jgi:hypothetical protein
LRESDTLNFLFYFSFFDATAEGEHNKYSAPLILWNEKLFIVRNACGEDIKRNYLRWEKIQREQYFPIASFVTVHLKYILKSLRVTIDFVALFLFRSIYV